MKYFAHSENNYGIKESVYDHVSETAKLASYYGSLLRIENGSKAAALLHDGKNSDIFQEVLAHKKVHVDHAVPGSYYAIKHYKKNGLLISIAIKGHHSGLDSGYHKSLKPIFDDLRSGVRFRDGVEYSITGDTEIVNAYRDLFFWTECAPETLEADWIELYETRQYLSLMLYQRMLFSVLVDADYTATAAHFSRKFQKYEYAEERFIDEKLVKNMKFELEKYRSDIIAGSVASTEINSIRNAVYEDCVKTARRQCGAYTLTAPTGTGKTLAMLAFALEHILYNHNTRIIVVLPYLSLIDQTAHIYKKIFKDSGIVYEDHSLAHEKRESNESFYVERWNSPIIITTTVRFFETLFGNKAPDCRKLHNVGNSVILFDEAQSMPPELAAPTLGALAYLCRRFGSTVVFSTATQPAFEYMKDLNSELNNWKPKEIIVNFEVLFDRCRRVNVEWRIDKQTSFDEVTDEASEMNQCCIIVNNKTHATEIYSRLKLLRPDSAFHISTNMCPSHRMNVLNEIKKRLEQRLECHVVSTQCIEAGVDLDFPKLFRAIAPMDAIIQAAGRCNRKGDPDMGSLVVFIPEGDSNRDYPSGYYHDCTNVLKNMLSENGGNIDIYSVKTIKEYYQHCFTEKESKKKLVDAIECLDYAETSSQYVWIEERPEISLIVPYEKETELYNRLVVEARENGIGGEWIQQAREISVNVSLNKKADIEGVIENVRFMKTGKADQVKSNWFILLLNNETYNQKYGLDFRKGYFDNYAF